MLVMSISMHYAGLLGAPRRTAEVAYMGAQTANAWQPYMLLAAAGGAVLFISIVQFVIVAVGTLFANEKTHDFHAEFAAPSDVSDPTPPILQHLYRWGVVALIHHPGFLAPGMRTW